MKGNNILASIRFSLACIVMATAIGCATIPPAPAAPTCSEVCLHGKNLGCSWATATPNGASCVQVCDNAQRGPLPWLMSCAMQAETCEAADACNK